MAFLINKNISKLRTNVDYPFIKAYRVEPKVITLDEFDFYKVRIYNLTVLSVMCCEVLLKVF